MRYLLSLMLLLSLLGLAAEETPPSIEYPNTRHSSQNIDAGGVFVGVDKGVEWQGLKIYLSLTHDLLAVDIATGKTLWHHHVSGFWNGFAIKEVDTGTEKIWAVELHGQMNDRPTEVHTASYALKSGVKIDLPTAKLPGVSLMPLQRIKCQGTTAQRFYLLMTSPAGYAAYFKRMGRDEPIERMDLVEAYPPRPQPGYRVAYQPPVVDFNQMVVWACATGDSANTTGYSAVECREDEQRVVLRIKSNGFQTVGRWWFNRSCDLFVLPRRKDKTYILELDAQRFIAGPHLWRELARQNITDGTHDLDALPAPSAPQGQDFKRELQHFKSQVMIDGKINDWIELDELYEYDFYVNAAGKKVFHGPFRKYGLENVNSAGEVSHSPDYPEATFYTGQYVDGLCDGVWSYAERKAGILNRTPKFTETYQMGERHGPVQVWDSKGQLETSGAFEHNLAHGTWSEYKNGHLVFERTYTHGLLDGPYRTWREDGHPLIDAQYQQGQLIGEYKRLRADGSLLVKGQFVKGEYAPKLFSNTELPLLRGYRQGEWSWYLPDGKLLWQGTLEHGTGEWAEFDEAGHKLMAGHMVEGEISGEWRTWDLEGRLRSLELIMPGARSTCTTYYASGVKQSERSWGPELNAVGHERWWDYEGNLESEGVRYFGEPWSGTFVFNDYIETYVEGQRLPNSRWTRKVREEVAARELKELENKQQKVKQEPAAKKKKKK